MKGSSNEGVRMKGTSVNQADRRDRKVVAAVKALTGTKQESVLSDGIAIEWKALQFTNDLPKSKKWWLFEDSEETSYKKKIMMNVTGKVSPGQILAVMGPEGSGKSLLLRILSGRLHDPDNLTGSVTYNGLPFTESFRRKIGFVEQVSFLLENLTVKETLMFTALLRLPPSTEEIDRLVRVEHVLDSLELTQCANTVVGLVGGTLNNERRRLAIGVEMITNPPLLLLDEPTSGLDGAMALRITRTLAAYASAGRTVIATMKQPSGRMFDLFSSLLLLAEGNSIYFGPASRAMSYFEGLGHRPSYNCSPAEYLLDLAVSEPSDASIHYGTTLNLIREWRQRMEINAQEMPKVNETIAHGNDIFPNSNSFSSNAEEKDQRKLTPFFQFKTVTLRNAKAYNFTGSYVAFGMITVILFAILIGCLWNQRKNDTEGIRDKAGLLYFLVMFWSILPVFSTFITFLQDRQLLRAEQEAGMYSASVYYVSRMTLYLPYEILPPIVFSSIVYWMTDLNDSGSRFFLFLLTLILNCMIGSSIGLVISAISSSIRQAAFLSSVSQLFFFVLVDFLWLNAPGWIEWLKYISYSTYVNHLLMRIVFPSTSDYSCTNANGTDSCSILQHPEIHNRLKSLNGGTPVEVFILISMLVAYRILAFLFLRWGISVGRVKFHAFNYLVPQSI